MGSKESREEGQEEGCQEEGGAKKEGGRAGDDEPSISGYHFGEIDLELDNSDSEPDPDKESDEPGERQRFIKERQVPGREHKWRDPEGRERIFVDPPSYDATKDQEEMRKVKRQVSALVAKKRKRVKV